MMKMPTAAPRRVGSPLEIPLPAALRSGLPWPPQVPQPSCWLGRPEARVPQKPQQGWRPVLGDRGSCCGLGRTGSVWPT